MNVALIGYGYWGKILSKYLQESNHYKLTMICSKEVETEGIFTNDLNSVLENPQIEAVFVCTPTPSHFQICKKALESGKHVFCEKPTVKSLNEFKELSSIATRMGKILYTDYIYTVSPGINQAKNILHLIGGTQHIDCSIRQFGQFYPSDDVYEVIGVHMLSTVLYIMEDQCIDVSFQNHIGEKKCECGTLNLRFAKGGTASIICSLLDSQKERKVYIYGKKGTILFDMCAHPTVKLLLYKNSESDHSLVEECSWDFDEGNSIALSIAQFQKCIETMSNHVNRKVSEDILTIYERKRHAKNY